MKFIPVALRLSVILAMLLGSLGVAGGAAAAQTQDFEPGLYSSTLANVDIEVSGPEYEIVEAELQHYEHGEGEVIGIEPVSGVSHAEVSFYDDDDTPDDTIEIYLSSMSSAADDFAILDEGTDGDWQYVLASVDYEGLELLYYVRVQEDVVGNVDQLEAFLAPTEASTELLVSAQEEITIDSIGFMSDVDAAALTSMAVDGPTEAPQSTPVTTQEEMAVTDRVLMPSSGVEVGIGPDFTFVDNPSTDGEIENVSIQGTGTVSFVAIGETGDTPVEILDQFQAGFGSVSGGTETIYREEGDETFAWRVLWLPASGANPGSFMLLVVDTTTLPGYELLTAHYLPIDDVENSLMAIQGQIFVDGQSVLVGIDPADIDAITGDFEVLDPNPDGTATPGTVESDQGDEGNPRDGARIETSGDDDTTPEATEDPDIGDSGDVELSLTESSWEGGVFGHVFEWESPTWYFDEENGATIVSDFDAGEDTILINSDEGTQTVFLWLSVYGAEDSTPGDYYDYWLHQDFIDEFESDGTYINTEVIGSRTRGGDISVVFRYELADGGGEYVMVRQAKQLDDGTILVVTLDTAAEDMLDVYGVAREDITLDGDQIFTVFSPSQLDRLLGE